MGYASSLLGSDSYYNDSESLEESSFDDIIDADPLLNECDLGSMKISRPMSSGYATASNALRQFATADDGWNQDVKLSLDDSFPDDEDLY